MAEYTYYNKRTPFVELRWPNESLNWVETDSNREYDNNKSDVDPIYRGKQIEYNFNSHGYRCNELNSYPAGNFLLAVGCSYTQGVGLFNEHVWCNVLGNSLDMPAMNLGAPGMGLEYVMYTTLNYLNGDFPLPKVAVIQHSEVSRVAMLMKYHEDPHARLGVDHGIASDNQSPKEYFIEQNNDGNYTNLFKCGYYTDIITKMWNDAGVPVIHWTFSGDGDNFFSDYTIHSYPEQLDIDLFPKWDYYNCARDMLHDGHIKHAVIAEQLQRNVENLLNKQALHELADPDEVMFGSCSHATNGNSEEQLAKEQILARRSRSNIIYD